MRLKLHSFVLTAIVLGAATFPSAPVAATDTGARIPDGFVEHGALVTVLDQDNHPIRDLTPAEFLVFEDGVQREVTSASLTDAPISVAILIDTTKSSSGILEPTQDIRTALLTFVRTMQAATPQAEVSITEFAGAGVLLRSFTTKPEDLEKSIKRIVPNQRINSVLLETMVDAAKDLGKRSGPRRVMLTIDRGSGESSQIQPQRVADAVAESAASVWSISVDGHNGTSSPNRDLLLDVLTEQTGGLRLTAQVPSALEMLTKTIADALTSQYLITYMRPEGPAPKTVVPAATRGTKFLRAPWKLK